MIEIDGVSKRFGELQVLSDVSLRIDAGERLAFVGANGSGKTTLLRAILGLVRIQGAIRVAGIDVAREAHRALAHLAYIPQVAPPLEAPVAEVVRAFASLRGTHMSHVAERAERLGLSLAKIERARFRDLSGGMKQKLLAALALAARAPIMLCDEPTANLDPAARASFFEQMREEPAARVVVLCSHRAEEVRELVDRVIELEDGRVHRQLTASELLASATASSESGIVTVDRFDARLGQIPATALRLVQ